MIAYQIAKRNKRDRSVSGNRDQDRGPRPSRICACHLHGNRRKRRLRSISKNEVGQTQLSDTRSHAHVSVEKMRARSCRRKWSRSRPSFQVSSAVHRWQDDLWGITILCICSCNYSMRSKAIELRRLHHPKMSF